MDQHFHNTASTTRNSNAMPTGPHVWSYGSKEVISQLTSKARKGEATLSIMAFLGRLLSRRFSVTVLHRPPIVVQQTVSAGRGVFATRDIAQGEFLHSAEPIVAHPKLNYVSKVCYYCLRTRDHLIRPPAMTLSEEPLGSNVNSERIHEADSSDSSGIRADSAAPLFCSTSCAANAENFFIIESRGDWSELHHYCRKSSLKFPLVARRLACMVAAGAVSPDALDILSHPSFPDGTPLQMQWAEERALLLRTLKDIVVHPSALKFLSEEWYAGVIARLHINAFAVEMIDTSSHVDLFEATASAISGEGSVGTAVYALPSLFNHDCDPNVHVQWPGSASVRLEARQPIKAGEELRITYVDASLAYQARQDILNNSYGFLCECPRCRDRD